MVTPREIIVNVMLAIDAISKDNLANKPFYTGIEKLNLINTAVCNFMTLAVHTEGDTIDLQEFFHFISEPLIKAYCCSLNNSHEYPEAAKALVEAANKANHALPETIRYECASSS